MRVVPLTLKQENEYVEENHRHHKRCVGHRFSLAALDEDDKIIGVAIVGRPVARKVDPYKVAEVLRLCTDGSKNACSFLYGACARVAKEMGFEKIQTYILDSEDGTSLKASGWQMESTSPGGQWKHTDGKPRRTDQPTQPKTRWAKIFRQK